MKYEIDITGWDYEDQLDIKDINMNLFAASKIIDGVRMYPYVENEYGKFYLGCEWKPTEETKKRIFNKKGVTYANNNNIFR